MVRRHPVFRGPTPEAIKKDLEEARDRILARLIAKHAVDEQGIGE